MAASAQEIVFAGFSLLCAGIASRHDVRERRIPNLLTGPALFAGLLLHLIFGGWNGLGSSALAALLAGLAFFVFFVAGGMGAGDVKLMAAVGGIVALGGLSQVMLSTVFAGALFALAKAVYHGRLRTTLSNVSALLGHHSRHGLDPHPEMNLDNEQSLRLPFALPIAAGCAVYLGTLLLEGKA